MIDADRQGSFGTKCQRIWVKVFVVPALWAFLFATALAATLVLALIEERG